MTAQQLIAELQKLRPEQLILTPSQETGGLVPVIERQRVRLQLERSGFKPPLGARPGNAVEDAMDCTALCLTLLLCAALAEWGRNRHTRQVLDDLERRDRRAAEEADARLTRRLAADKAYPVWSWKELRENPPGNPSP